MICLILIFIIVRAIEIGIFIWRGSQLGVLPVVLLIVLTGMIGVAFVKQQGLETWKKVQFSLYNSEPPGDHILDGVCILLGGILLLATGFFTDIVGFLFVISWTIKPFIRVMIN